MLDKCVVDDGLPKAGMEREKEKLEPLIKDFVKKSNDNINALNETEGDHDDLIESCEMSVDIVEMKWQKFLTLNIKFRKWMKRQRRLLAQTRRTRKWKKNLVKSI